MRASRRRAPQSGAAALELALILPLLLLVSLLGVDFGRFAATYIALANSARAGAAYACMNNYTPSTQAAWTANVQQAASDEMRNQVGDTNIGNLVVTVSSTPEPTGLRRVLVTTEYPFSMTVNWSWLGLPRAFTLRHQAEMRLIR